MGLNFPLTRAPERERQLQNPKDDSQKDRTQYERLGLRCFGRSVSPKAGCETRAGVEQELQNQQPHLGEVRPDDGM